MSKTRRSFIWNLAKKISPDKVKCNVCSKIMSINGGSTTNLIRHMKNKHPSENLSNIKSREVRSLSFKDLISKEKPKSSKSKHENINTSLPSTSDTLTDWKSNTTITEAKINESNEGTGRTSPHLSLSEREKRFINLIEETITEGDYSEIEIGKTEVTDPALVSINHEVVDEPYFWDRLDSPNTKNLSKATLSSIHKRKLAEESTLQLKRRIFQERLTQPNRLNEETLTLLKGIKENTESMASSLKDIASLLREHLSQTK